MLCPKRLGPKQTSVLVPVMGITKLINIIPVPILMVKIVISAEHNAITTLTKQNSVNKRNHKVPFIKSIAIKKKPQESLLNEFLVHTYKFTANRIAEELNLKRFHISNITSRLNLYAYSQY